MSINIFFVFIICNIFIILTVQYLPNSLKNGGLSVINKGSWLYFKREGPHLQFETIGKQKDKDFWITSMLILKFFSQGESTYINWLETVCRFHHLISFLSQKLFITILLIYRYTFFSYLDLSLKCGKCFALNFT